MHGVNTYNYVGSLVEPLSARSMDLPCSLPAPYTIHGGLHVCVTSIVHVYNYNNYYNYDKWMCHACLAYSLFSPSSSLQILMRVPLFVEGLSVQRSNQAAFACIHYKYCSHNHICLIAGIIIIHRHHYTTHMTAIIKSDCSIEHSPEV